MNKTSQKVTKDPKRQERCKTSHKTYMKTLKEKILEDNQDKPTPSTPSPTGDSMPFAPSHATRSNGTYLCQWCWYTYCPCHWCLCLFCI